MKPALLFACMCFAGPLSLTMAQPQHDHGTHALHAAEPVNAMCPIGKESIVPSAGTVEYKGRTIGLCCPGCGEQFLAWDEACKDEFIALAVAGREPGMAHAEHDPPTGDGAPRDEPLAWSDPYPLDACPISGGKLGSMGDPIVKRYDDREVRFCCAPCIGKFEADLDASWRSVDEAIVKDQMRYYPVTTCVVLGDPLVEDVAVSFVYRNRLIRLCCTMCKQSFESDPGQYLSILNKAAADMQRPDYPLDTCLVSGNTLGSMGEPTEMIVAGRLMRFCCAGCESKVESDPAKFISTIDASWQAEGLFMPAVQSGGEGADHRHRDHGG